eukprot:2444501-Pyramimonas_sp.AAC.1
MAYPERVQEPVDSTLTVAVALVPTWCWNSDVHDARCRRNSVCASELSCSACSLTTEAHS